jgi:hypothetical protein
MVSACTEVMEPLEGRQEGEAEKPARTGHRRNRGADPSQPCEFGRQRCRVKLYLEHEREYDPHSRVRVPRAEQRPLCLIQRHAPGS